MVTNTSYEQNSNVSNQNKSDFLEKTIIKGYEQEEWFEIMCNQGNAKCQGNTNFLCAF